MMAGLQNAAGTARSSCVDSVGNADVMRVPVFALRSRCFSAAIAQPRFLNMPDEAKAGGMSPNS